MIPANRSSINCDKIAIHWFQQDLRLLDNPALNLASKHKKVLPIYIVEDGHNIGATSKQWLYHSLRSLSSLLGESLSIYQGDSIKILDQIIEQFNIGAVYWNRCYEPWCMTRDIRMINFLEEKNVYTETANGSLLWEPEEIKKIDRSPYQVFTPFYKKGCLKAREPRLPLSKPESTEFIKDSGASFNLEQSLRQNKFSSRKVIENHWLVGQENANYQLKKFLKNGIHKYKDGRNVPSKAHVSKLSPHLHFGEISPNQIWYAVKHTEENRDTEHFLSELVWREFSYNLLYYNHNLPQESLNKKFELFPWSEDIMSLNAWKQGKTGIPIVDAGMRELDQTGYMHNRLRMITGSFLVKNLRIHWQEGLRFFWDKLVDADLANNSAGWQWVTGCGVDAAPYFRIFNPVLQSRKFDPQGEYIRMFVPEIASLPNNYLFNPWDAPDYILEEARVRLGYDYPKPIVNLEESRKFALQSFSSLTK